MKITKSQLKQIIKEEMENVLNEKEETREFQSGQLKGKLFSTGAAYLVHPEEKKRVSFFSALAEAKKFGPNMYALAKQVLALVRGNVKTPKAHKDTIAKIRQILGIPEAPGEHAPAERAPVPEREREKPGRSTAEPTNCQEAQAWMKKVMRMHGSKRREYIKQAKENVNKYCK